MSKGFFYHRIVVGTVAALFFLQGLSGYAQDVQDMATEKYFAANALYNKKLYDLAIEEYKDFLAKYPTHKKYLSAKLGLALCYYETGKYKEAEPIFAELADKRGAPHQEQIHNLWGQCLLIGNEPARAEVAFRWSVDRGKERLFVDLPGVAQRSEESPEVSVASLQDLEPLERSMAGLIEAQYQQGKWNDVVRTTKEMLERIPNGQYTNRVMFLSSLANYELKDYKAAAAILEQLVKRKSPFLEQSYFLLAECQHKLGDLDKAEISHEIVARKLKGSLSKNALFRLGYIRFLQKKYKLAIRDFADLRATFSTSPEASQAGVYLGRCYLELEDFAKAQSVFGSLSEDKAVKTEANLWLSETFLRQKKYDMVIDVLKPILTETKRTNPDLYPNIVFNYANALMGLDRFAEAADAFKDVTQDESPLKPDSLRLQAYCLSKKRDFKGSLSICTKFLDDYSNNPSAEDVRFIKAENLFFLDQLDPAIKTYRQFIPWEGKSKYTDQAIFRISQCLCEQKKWDAALSEMRPLLKTPPTGVFYEQLFYLAGISAFNLQKWETASQYLKTFVTDHPTKPNADSALLKSANAYVRLKRLNDATGALEQLIAAYPDSPLIAHSMTELGKLYFELKKYPKGRQYLEKVCTKYKKTPFYPEAEYYLGWIALSEKKANEALTHFTVVSDQYPKHALAGDALYQQALQYVERKDFAKANNLLKRFLSEYKDNSNAEQASFYFAITKSRQGSDAKGNVFEQFIREHPKSPLVPRILYEAAWNAREKKQLKQARDFYEQLIKDYPIGKLAKRATFELAELEYEEKNYDKAINYLDKLQAAGADLAMEEKILYRMGWCLLGRKQTEEALDAFERVVKQFPDSEFVPVAAYQAGEIRLKSKEFHEAFELFEKSVKSKHGADIKDHAMLRMGECQTLIGRWNDAEETFQTFLKTYPNSKYERRAYLWLGWSRENLKKYKDAVTDYNLVLKSGRRDELAARAQFQKGECAFAMKKYDDAIKEFIKVELNYSFPEWGARSMLELAHALDKKGQTKEANEQLKKVIKKYPETNEATLAREMLEERRAL